MSVAARPSQHPAPSFLGLYSATVVGVEDQQHRGRIEVVVPSVYGTDASAGRAWARPCLPFGHVFVPQVDDRVWVAFEGGDPAAPVWLGIWYPVDGAPQDARVTPPVKRLVRSASGHQVLLDDSPGQEKVVVSDRGGSRIELSGTEVRLHAAQALTIVAPGTSITIESGAIVLKATSVDVQAA